MTTDQQDTVTGRLSPEEWEDAEQTTPALVLPAAYFDMCREDRILRAAGPERAALATPAGFTGATVAWDAVAQRMVDEAELPAIAWVP